MAELSGFLFRGFENYPTETCISLLHNRSERGLQSTLMNELDPMGYISEDHLLGGEIEEVLRGKTEGTDYTVSDVYGDGSVYSYAMYPEFDYFGFPEKNTGVRMFVEDDEGITMVCYDLMIPSDQKDLIMSKMQDIMQRVREVYGKGYDFGTYYDPSDQKKYISFDDMVKGIRNGDNGTYSFTWVSDDYDVSMDINYDKNQSVSLGTVRFMKVKPEWFS